jgi:hypothetical protein
MRAGTAVELPGLRIRKISRLDQSHTAADGQPRAWTVIDFETDDDLAADSLSRSLAGALAAEGGWYSDFTVGGDHVVIYADKVFRYRIGDGAARARAAAYGRSVGVPDHQLDWRD